MKICLFLVLLVFIGESVCFNGYYWKDYTGRIPRDAFPAGHDTNNKKTYVGLVYVAEEGIFPATIYPDEKTVYAAVTEAEPSQNFVQILCTDSPQNLVWITANRTDFHFITMNKHLVRGGIQETNWLNIGRVSYQGEVIIGKVMSGRAPINDAHMKYVHNREVKVAFSYEVLTFEDPNRSVELLTNSIEAS